MAKQAAPCRVEAGLVAAGHRGRTVAERGLGPCSHVALRGHRDRVSEVARRRRRQEAAQRRHSSGSARPPSGLRDPRPRLCAGAQPAALVPAASGSLALSVPASSLGHTLLDRKGAASRPLLSLSSHRWLSSESGSRLLGKATRGEQASARGKRGTRRWEVRREPDCRTALCPLGSVFATERRSHHIRVTAVWPDVITPLGTAGPGYALTLRGAPAEMPAPRPPHRGPRSPRQGRERAVRPHRPRGLSGGRRSVVGLGREGRCLLLVSERNQ